MILHDLLLECNFEQLLEEYQSIHGKVENVEFYRYYLEVLRNKTPVESDEPFTIKIRYGLDFSSHEEYLDVYGSYDEDDEYYSISMTDWNNIVGYKYELGEFKESELIFSLIEDITFYGTEEDMVKQREELNQAMEDMKSGREKTITFSNIKEFLDALND